jgi:hypothetical protein
MQLRKRPPGRERSGRGSRRLESRLPKHPPGKAKRKRRRLVLLESTLGRLQLRKGPAGLTELQLASAAPAGPRRVKRFSASEHPPNLCSLVIDQKDKGTDPRKRPLAGTEKWQNAGDLRRRYEARR